MITTFTIAIDWNRNSWFLGMRQPWQDKADNSMLALTLRNNDRLYSPDNTGSPLASKLVPQRPVRIQSSDGTTTRTHWVGWIEVCEVIRYAAFSSPPASCRSTQRAITG